MINLMRIMLGVTFSGVGISGGSLSCSSYQIRTDIRASHPLP